MREHRALRLARGPRREHHLGQILRSDVRLRQRLPAARLVGQLLHLVERDPERRGALLRLHRDERRRCAGALRDLRDEVWRRVHVERNEDRAGTKRREDRDAVLGPVHAEHQHAVALLDARLGEISRGTRDEVGEIAIRPCARAESRLDDERVLVAELLRGYFDDVVQRLEAHEARLRSASRPPSRSAG